MPTDFRSTAGGDGKVLADEFSTGSVSLNAYTIHAYMSDANTAGSVYVVAPQAGTISGLYAVNGVANTTAKTVLTAKIDGNAVTAPAWEIASTQAAGTASSSVPTAVNTVTAGQVIEFASDGGGTPTMPVSFSILISR